MLYFNFKNYDEFKEKFGKRITNNGKEVRSNGILLSYLKSEMSQRHFNNLTSVSSMTNLYTHIIEEALMSGENVVLNINDKNTSMVLGEREIVLYGKGFVRDTLCGKSFRISPKSFYQVNSVQTEILYGKAVEFAGLTGKEKVIDAYCGIGTIGLVASGKAREVVGVELNKDAVRDARINARENKVVNISFRQGDAGEFMEAMAEAGEKADVVFMDPPRSGSSEKFLNSVIKLSPKKIVYISCNPETLARDLNFLTRKNYIVKEIQPVEMFCFTDHTEVVTWLEQK